MSLCYDSMPARCRAHRFPGLLPGSRLANRDCWGILELNQCKSICGNERKHVDTFECHSFAWLMELVLYVSWSPIG